MSELENRKVEPAPKNPLVTDALDTREFSNTLKRFTPEVLKALDNGNIKLQRNKDGSLTLIGGRVFLGMRESGGEFRPYADWRDQSISIPNDAQVSLAAPATGPYASEFAGEIGLVIKTPEKEFTVYLRPIPTTGFPAVSGGVEIK